MKDGKGINKMSLVPGFLSGDFNNSTHSSPEVEASLQDGVCKR